jgi:H+/Cl- antiporter ClcA
VTLFARIFRHGPLRFPRKALVMVVLASYLFAGAVHSLLELDVTNATGSAIASLVDQNSGHSDPGVVADHHCHGCFSVSMPAPAGAVVVAFEMTGRPAVQHDVRRRSLPRGIDPPPPKTLI